MGECSRCGDCCRQIIFGVSHGGEEWQEYYFVHGCKIIPNVGLLVPSVCQHLKEINDGMGSKECICDIYEDRPALCRHDNKNQRYYRPPGCTEV